MKPFFKFKLKTSRMNLWMEFSSTTITIAFLGWAVHTQQSPTVTQQFTPVARYGPDFIYLPDGSTIMLDENAELLYNVATYEKQREVTLTGQAYFEVKHNINNTVFRVHTSNVTTTVLGTTFNIDARAGHPQVSVTVAHGKVAVGSKITTYDVVTDRQQINVDNFSLDFAKTIVDVSATIAWRKKYSFIFNDTPLTEVKSIIEEAYQVKITVDKELNDLRITATFEKGRRLNEVLGTISTLVNASYTTDGNRVEITSNKHAKNPDSSKRRQ